MNLLRLMVLCATVCVAGCSSFDSEYKTAVSAIRPAGGIEGAWEGKWQSEAGHGGDTLKCILAKADQDQYTARFKATFAAILHFEHSMKLTARPSEGAVGVTGEEDLAGDLYKYEGQITADEFKLRYTSKNDHGTFMLRRPAKSGE